MDYTHIISQMLMIFSVILVGFVSAKLHLWPSDLNKKMSVFVLNVTAPLLILASVMGDGLVFSSREIGMLMLVSVLNYVVLIAGALLLSAIWNTGSPARRGLLRFMVTFGNVTFIGFPVVSAVFGPRAVFYASVLTIPFNVLIFTIGISFVTGHSARQAFSPRLVFSPCVVASLAAVVLALLKVQTPEPIANFCHLLGDMTIPCALLIIGASLSTIPLRDMMGSRFIYGVAITKLLLMPLIVMGVFRLLGFGGPVADVAVLLSGMPVAANGIMFCLKYGQDERKMTQGIFITTLMSVVSIPLVAMML